MLRFIALLILLLVVISYFEDSRRGFYGYTAADIDLIQIPLIEPYTINSGHRDGIGWNVMHDSPMLANTPFFALGADSVGLGKDLIIIYSNHEVLTDTMAGVWYVFDTNLKRGSYYINQQQYQQFLQKAYQLKSVKLYEPQTIWNKFKDKYELPPEWQPYIEMDKKKRWWVFWD